MQGEEYPIHPLHELEWCELEKGPWSSADDHGSVRSQGAEAQREREMGNHAATVGKLFPIVVIEQYNPATVFIPNGKESIPSLI